MPMVHLCATEGCEVLTMCEYCLDCETAEFYRDRPELLRESRVPRRMGAVRSWRYRLLWRYLRV
jgi:hypothetical protein